jgi:thiamine-phosphate pyrophosphorylase
MARSKSQKARSSKGNKARNNRREAAPSQVRSRLFLVTPPDLPPAELSVRFQRAVAGGDVACVLVRGSNPDELRARTEALLPVAVAHNVALLVENDPGLAVTVGADGVQIDADLQTFNAVRSQLAEGMILGVRCGLSRHAAMELGEAGADYVAFDEGETEARDETAEVAELLEDDEEVWTPHALAAWWASVFEVPAVAFMESDADSARELAAQGVEFIRPLDDMWTSEQTAEQTVARLNELFEEVLSDERS